MTKISVFLMLMTIVCGCSTPRYTTESVLQAQQFDEARSHESDSPVATPARLVPKTPRSRDYLALNQEHWIALPMERGAKIKLEDGSVWAIARQYQPQTMIWLVSEKVLVTEDSANPQYPYKLTNRTRQVSVEASLISQAQ